MGSYGSLSTEFYDLDKPEAPERAASFYVEMARRAKGRILEPMCGSGRFLLPMLRAGLRVDGTDASPQMLAACQARLKRETLDAALYEQALERLSLPDRYRMIYVPSGSIGLIVADTDLRAGLERMRAHLEPGGVLWIELADTGQSDVGDEDALGAPRSVTCEDGTTITYSFRVERRRAPAVSVFVGTYQRQRDGTVLEVEHEELPLRHHTITGFEALLRSSGFDQVSVHGVDGLPFLAEAGCTMIEARGGA